MRARPAISAQTWLLLMAGLALVLALLASCGAGELRSHTIDSLTVHHTAVLLSDNRDAPAQVRSVQRYHQGLGWADIAYHFLVDRNGHVYQGRPVDAPGDSRTSYDPTGHLLVTALGNFQEQVPTAEQVESVARLLAWGAGEYSISPPDVTGHRDHAATACPGASVYALIEHGELGARVDTLLDGGGVDLNPICGEEGAARVAAIEIGTD